MPKSPDYLHRRLSKHGLLRPQRFLFPTTTCLSVHVCTANADKPDGDGVFERWSDNHPSTGGRVGRKPGHGDGVFEKWGVITSPQDPCTGGRVRRKPGRRSARGTHLSGCCCSSSSSGLKGTLSPGCVCLGPQCAARDELQGGESEWARSVPSRQAVVEGPVTSVILTDCSRLPQ